MPRSSIVLVVLALLLAGCGSTKEDRTLSGAGIGAGTGAVVGAVTGLGVVNGLLIGTIAGGATGLLTDQSQVNLGKPVWRQGSGSETSAAGQPQNQQTAYAAPAASETTRGIQAGLVKLGFDPGPVDGVAGSKTRSAIRAYQQQYGLAVDGLPSPEVLAHFQGKLAGK
jgi:peptidoglycan hydrolase-like protein with peptidoglycan-binding domain